MSGHKPFLQSLAILLATCSLAAQDTKDTELYRRLKEHLDSIPAIDTHDHLWPFDRLRRCPWNS